MTDMIELGSDQSSSDIEFDRMKQGSVTLSESIFDMDKINRKNSRPNSCMNREPNIDFSRDEEDKKIDDGE